MNFEQLNNYPLNQKYHDDGQYIIVQLLLFNSIVDPNHNQQFATMTQATMIQTTMNPSHRGVGFNNSLNARGAQRPRALATWPPGRRPVRFDPNHNEKFATMTKAPMIQTTMNPSHRGVGLNNSLHA